MQTSIRHLLVFNKSDNRNENIILNIIHTSIAKQQHGNLLIFGFTDSVSQTNSSTRCTSFIGTRESLRRLITALVAL
jgi:hypothetical protein